MKSIRELPELTQRVIAAMVGVVIILTAIIYSEWTYFGVFFLLCMFTMLEFYKLIGLDDSLPLKTFGTFVGMLFFVLTFVIEKSLLAPKFYLLIFLGLSAAYLIKLYKKSDIRPFRNIAYTFLGILYVAMPFSLLNMCIFYDGAYHHEVIVGSLFILWASDTGAYFSGKTFGRRKLFERISPKKTWEGSIGGGLFAIAIGQGMAQLYDSLSIWQWLCISIIIVVAGTYGDLVESLFKRSIAIKDSGNTIPGHGGFLDRFDGLLIAAPFIVAFLRLF